MKTVTSLHEVNVEMMRGSHADLIGIHIWYKNDNEQQTNTSTMHCRRHDSR